MQYQFDSMAMVLIVAALLLLFGPERAVGFGRDLQKAWHDFVGMFKR